MHSTTGSVIERRTLGNSDMRITRVGLGTWAIGGGNWEFGWGSQNDEESIATIHKALDAGINWIDTAAVYGLGRSEEIVGKAVKQRTEKPYVFTKCTMVWNAQREVSHSMTAASLRRELEASLRRLQVERIDLYQIHWPNPDNEIEEGWSTLAEFQREGKVRYIGVSNFNVEQMERAEKIAPITSLQPPYSLIDREIERDILPYCQRHNIGVIVYSPMASGLLTGTMTRERIDAMPADDWRRRAGAFQEPQLSRNLVLADKLREIGQRHGLSAGEVAVAWTLRHPAVTAAIVGARRPDQVDHLTGGATFHLSDAEAAQIEQML